MDREGERERGKEKGEEKMAKEEKGKRARKMWNGEAAREWGWGRGRERTKD